MSNKPSIKVFNVYEFLNIDKSEKTEIIFEKIINKLLEFNILLNTSQYRSKETILKLQKILTKVLIYFRSDEERKAYDDMIESQIKKDDYLNKCILFSHLIDEIKKLEKQYKMKVNIDYFQLLEIIDFITNISDKKFRKIDSRISNYNFAMNYIKRVFVKAYLNNKDNVSIEDFISVSLENEKLTVFYKEKFASDIFNNWYPVLKK